MWVRRLINSLNEREGIMNKKRLTQRFLRYVTCASESRDEREFCLMLEDELKEMGVRVGRDESGEKCGSNGWNIRASLPGHGEPILFCAHLDTVSPGKGIKPVLDGGVIRSGGDTVLGADDKAGVAAIMEAFESLTEHDLAHRPVEALFTICEELGLMGSKHADYSAFSSRQAVVLDSGPAVGSIINRAPANIRIHVKITGKSAHAGIAPNEGVHALKAAAAAISSIPCGYVDDESVMNIANMLAPGKTNVVPSLASFNMEIRSFSEATLDKHLKAAKKAVKDACDLYGASYSFEPERHSSVLHVPENGSLICLIRKALNDIGVEGCVDRTFGGSDATWLNANGIEAVNIGIGMKDAHSVTEHIAVDDLETTARLVMNIALSVS